MHDATSRKSQRREVIWMKGDDTVMCLVVTARGRVAIVANERYPHAERHADGHLDGGIDDVLICGPDCAGA